MAERNRVIKGSGNVFADMSCVDAVEHHAKARLVIRIAKLIKQRNLTQAGAAKELGIDHSKISALLRGRFRGFSVHQLMRFIADLG